MGFFKKIPPIKGGIFWCYRVGDEPDSKIHEIVERHRGRLIPVLGFDELMLQLWEKLQLPSPIPDLQATHDKRKTEFQRQFEELNKKLKRPAETKAAEAEIKQVREAAAAAVERLTKEKNWWAWELKANAEPDPQNREAIYRDGLKDFPESAELAGNFAMFMKNARKEYDEAERLYRTALKLDPNHANNIGSFANFMWEIRKDNDEAERLYRRALELDPKEATNIGNFATFMWEIRKDLDTAEWLYRKALELDPKHAIHAGNYAEFLEKARKNHFEANRFYRLALGLDPNHEWAKNEFARFLKEHPEFAK